MLDGIKTWLEGLFRPVFRVTEGGSTYIARTPTVWDCTGTHSYFTGTISLPAATGYYSGKWLIRGDPIVITGAKISGSIADMGSIWAMCDIGDDAIFIRTDDTVTLAGTTSTDAFTTAPGPLYLHTGEGFRVTAYTNNAAARTLYFTIRYREVR